jgi:hypothetical protein
MRWASDGKGARPKVEARRAIVSENAVDQQSLAAAENSTVLLLEEMLW